MKDTLAIDITKHANHRVIFYPGFQKHLITNVVETLKVSLRRLVDYHLALVGLSYSAWKKFKREELHLPLKVVVALCDVAGMELNEVLLSVKELREPNWGSIKGGKLGIKAVMDKYGESELQRRRVNGGKKLKGTELAKLLMKPPIGVELAEFIGIHLGDGTMTRDFLRISGDARYDLPYLSNYVSVLVNKLFAVSPVCYFDRNTFNVRVTSRALCRYLANKLGIPYGSKIKNGAVVPRTILGDKNLFLACVRGLVDTDGSVSKDGSTISIRFHSSNPSLLDSLIEGIETHELDFFTFFYERSIGTHSISRIEDYFRAVGSSNLKHVIKFNEWYFRKKFVRTMDVLNYFERYRTVSLPFYIKNDENIMGPWSSG